MKKMLLIAIILFTIVHNSTYSNQINGENQILYSNNLYPKYNKNINDYSLRDCDKKNTDLFIKKGYNIKYNNKLYENKLGIFLKKDEIVKIIINKHVIYIRCLPDNFPKLTFNKKSQSKYFYTFATANRKNINNWYVENGYYIIADENGTPIWYMKGSGSAMILKIYKDGNIYSMGLPPGVTPSYGARKGSAIMVSKLDGTLIKKIKPADNNYVIDTHGFEKLSNGNFLLMTSKIITNYDLSKYTKNLTPFNIGGGGTKQCDVTNTKSAKVSMPFITEITPDGEIKKLIRFDKIIPPNESQLFALSDIDYTAQKPNCIVSIYHPVNLSTTDNETRYVLTNRFTSATYIIDKNKEEVIAKIGGIKTDNSFNIIEDPYGERGPIGHHGGYIKNNKLILLDNRRIPEEKVRSVIYQLDYEKKEATHIQTLTQPTKDCDLIDNKIVCLTYSMGTSLFLEDDSILATWGFRPKSSNMATHFDKEGNIIVDLINRTENQTTYQVNYIEKENLDIELLRKSASSNKVIKLPFENKLGWSIAIKDGALIGPGN